MTTPVVKVRATDHRPANEPHLLYLIALIEPGQRTSPGIEAIAAADDITIEPFDTLDAIVRRVPASMFTGDDAEDRLADVSWLAPHAEAHDRVLRRLLQRGISTWPAGFGSVFTSRETLRSRVDACAPHADEYFQLVNGAHEWSLRVHADLNAIRRELEPQADAAPTSGADYLRRKQRRDTREADLIARADALLDEAIESIEPHTIDIAERPIIASDEDKTWQLAHLALLIEPADQEHFDRALDAVAEALEPRGLSFTISGPWPTYSFCPRLGEDAPAREPEPRA